MIPIAPASNTRETNDLSGAITVTTGAIPLSLTKVKNIAKRPSSFNACSASTINISKPAFAAIFTTEGVNASNTLIPNIGSSAFNFSLAGLTINRFPDCINSHSKLSNSNAFRLMIPSTSSSGTGGRL